MTYTTKYYTTAPDYMLESQDLFGKCGFVLRYCPQTGEWQILMIV